MEKKKLLGLLPSFAAGGAEKILLMYFNNTTNRPFSLKLFVSNQTGPLKSNFTNSIECNYSRFLYAIPRLLLIINKNNINILFSTFPHITIILIITKILRLHSCKIVVRQPNMLFSSLNNSLKLRFIRFLYLRVINIADTIIITSEAMRKEAEEYNLNKNKLYLLTNPVNVLKVRKKVIPKRTKGLGLKLVYVGRLSYQKGLDRIIELFSSLNNIELLIIGEGEQKNYLQKIIKKNKLQNKITFFGFMKNPYNMIAGADCFLLPSRWEGMPNCVLESLALGTPVIAFKDIQSLNDLNYNIKNKTITLTDNNETLLNLLKSLKPRRDYFKPKLRKSLLINPLNEQNYRRKLDKIILNLLCKNPQK